MTLGPLSVLAITQSTFTLNARLTSCRNEFHRLITYCMIKNMLPASDLRGKKKREVMLSLGREREGTGFTVLPWDYLREEKG